MFLNDSEEMIKRSHITSDTVIINQCDEDGYKEEHIGDAFVRTFSVKERGLTKSRNLAISKSVADVCIICDDDEVFSQRYEEAVQKAYSSLPQADIIIFDMAQRPHKWGDSIKKLGYRDIMSVSSWQRSDVKNSSPKAFGLTKTWVQAQATVRRRNSDF